MNRIRLALSAVSLVAAVAFGCVVMFPTAKAEGAPYCNCNGGRGLRCNYNGDVVVTGQYCCLYTCMVDTEVSPEDGGDQ